MADYATETRRRNIEKLRNVIAELPQFCEDFFRGIENGTSLLTRLNYAYDLKLFFYFLTENWTKVFGAPSPLKEITLKHMDKLKPKHLEMFMEYVTYYKKDDREIENGEAGKHRKMAMLKSFFKYYFKMGALSSNIAQLVSLSKIHEKPIIRLEADEAANLLDAAESGDALSKTQQRYHKYTALRDVALLTLLLSTGIRVSELVGLNISDIDFSTNGFKVTRKGGSQAVLYFGPETESALRKYLEKRNGIIAATGSEDALFLSLQKKRMSTRSVQELVKKYSRIITPLKKISPHKLRSTYGTMLYHETGDIYLVADVLGHKDVNTTRKHYAAISDDKRRMAAKVVKLREE